MEPAVVSNPETVFCPFFKVERSPGGTEKTMCYGYIIIFLIQSWSSAYSSAGWAQKYPAKGASGAKTQLYSTGQILYPQAITAERRHLLLICAKALMG